MCLLLCFCVCCLVYYLIESFDLVFQLFKHFSICKDDNRPPNVFVGLQSGCCKPADDCGFTYVNPTEWTKNTTVSSANPDCSAWGNDLNTLCFNCQSCKAGLLDNLKSDWKKVAVVNIVFLIILIIVYSVGCCAFRNSRRDNAYWKR